MEPGRGKEDTTRNSEYLIEYMGGKGVLSVRYVTSIELNIENTDLLMFHCNYLSYNWSNITL